MAKFRRFQPGETIGIRDGQGNLRINASMAAFLNAAVAEMKRLGRVHALAPLRWTEDADGRRFACDLPPVIMAKLSGSGNPYSFAQQKYDPTTNTWSDLDGGRTGSKAFESKGKSGLAGKVVRLHYVPSAGDWRFQYVGYGGWALTFHLIGCNDCDVAGADVDFVLGDVIVHSGTTAADGRVIFENAPSGDYTINWSLPGTSYSGSANVTMPSPPENKVATSQVIPFGDDVCVSNCALPFPDLSTLYVTDDAGTRLLGACVPYDYFGFPWTATTTMTSEGACASPVWRVKLNGVAPIDGGSCAFAPGSYPATKDFTTACSRPFLISGTYKTSGDGPTRTHPLCGTAFTIHE